MRLMPCSIAARIVAMDSASSVPPHIQPPMAQVPRATRDTSSDVPTMAARSISISPVSVSPAMALLLLLRGLFASEPSVAQHRCCATCVAGLSVRHLAYALLLQLSGPRSACSENIAVIEVPLRGSVRLRGLLRSASIANQSRLLLKIDGSSALGRFDLICCPACSGEHRELPPS